MFVLSNCWITVVGDMTDFKSFILPPMRPNCELNQRIEQVCTFKLIVKNASSLLANKDPVKLEAEAMLDDLIR